MKGVIELLNALVDEKVISTYAIGGAIGAFFYIEAQHTEDVDAFAVLPTKGLLIDLGPIYDAAKKHGAKVYGEHLQVGDWKLQILPPKNDLVEEALRTAKPVQFMGVPTRVFNPEHLCAVMVDTGRRKDELRLHEFVKQKKVNVEELKAICQKFGILQKLEKWLSNLEEDVEDSAVASYIRESKLTFRNYTNSLNWEEKVKVVERLQANAEEMRKTRKMHF